MRKDKGVVIKIPSNNDEDSACNFEQGGGVGGHPTDFAVRSSPRNTSSKYDFVKVKVWLGDNSDHYYVLSRFLLCRMLTVTKIPNHVALKIALDLKKLLIDNSLLDVSQFDLEANLFKLMEWQGYGQEYINRYKMMTRFHHQRVPLVILVCGTACVGKSTIATQLAQRLNLPNVLQTDMVYELLRTSTDAPLKSSPVWARDFSSSEELITEFCRECRIVRKGLAGDLKKAMKDGKPIIIEGMHLDPSIYLMDDENKLPSNMQAKNEESKPMKADEIDATNLNHEFIACSDSEICHQNRKNFKSGEVVSSNDLNKVSNGLKSLHIVGSVPENKCDNIQESGTVSKPTLTREKSGVAEPIIIPIVLKMAEFDHKALLEEWISTRMFSDKYPIQDKDKLSSNLKTIQDYLCSFKSQGLTVANISATSFPQTLDWLHNYLLQCIERGISSPMGSRGQPTAS